MKRLSFLLLVVMAVLFANSCASAPKKREIPNRKITVEELQSNDGTAWVAIDGVVYDVTHNKSWCCGSHHGIKAGQDLSERIKKSPHGKRTLENLPIVGKLDDGKEPVEEVKSEEVKSEEIPQSRRGTPRGRPVEEPKVEAKPAPAPVAAPVVEPKPEPQPEPVAKEEPKEEVKGEEVKGEEKVEEKKEEEKKEDVKKEEPKKEEVKAEKKVEKKVEKKEEPKK